MKRSKGQKGFGFVPIILYENCSERSRYECCVDCHKMSGRLDCKNKVMTPLLYYRLKNRLTQRQLADMMKVSQQYIAAHELRDESVLEKTNYSSLKKFANAFGLSSVEYFFTIEVPK